MLQKVKDKDRIQKDTFWFWIRYVKDENFWKDSAHQDRIPEEMGQVSYFRRIYVLNLKCVQTSLYDFAEDNIDSVLEVTTISIGFQVHGILDEALIFTLA